MSNRALLVTLCLAVVTAGCASENAGPVSPSIGGTGTGGGAAMGGATGGKVELCHRADNGTYHLIDVSVDAEPAHRAHGDAMVDEPVPGTQRQVFDEDCRPVGPAVRIVKSTNGEDADRAPGPSIPVGDVVTWTYRVSNTGTISLTNIIVEDDQGVAVTCPQATLPAGQSMTCTGSGLAAFGQYRNEGTVTAQSASGEVDDSDPSHYLGVAPEEEEDADSGLKVDLCHRTGAGFYVLINVSVNAEPAHLAHGDGRPGAGVPGGSGQTFSAACRVQ